MYSRFTIAYKYLIYLITASNGKGHGIHSYFVYQLVTKVFNDDRRCDAFQKIEKLRKELKQDWSKIEVEDFGAGSSVSKSSYRTVASVAADAAKPPKFGKLFFRLVNYFQSKQILELGTSLGLSTAYLAAANEKSKVVTCEGSPVMAAKALENFEKLELKNIEVIVGDFDETISSVLKENTIFDLIFFDGNHRQEPTLRYFHQCLQHAGPDSVFIFDDIHWSSEMEEAWKEIQNHKDVTCTIDLFFAGLVFFKKEIKEKQNFIIRF